MPIIMYQGKHGAYSELAARSLFVGAVAEFIGCRQSREMFEALDQGQADYIIVPIENSTAGSVYDYYELLLDFSIRSDIVIVKEVKMKIRHNLIGIKGTTLQDINEVRSHHIALAQCRHYLRRAQIKPTEDFDTAGVLEGIVKQRLTHVAAIASVQAALDYGGEILASDIQDRDENYTRFLLVSKTPLEGKGTGAVKCSSIFCIRNERGSLFKTFGVFASRDLDIIRIETRPLIGTATSWNKFARPGTEGLWDTMFYLDFRGPAGTCRNAIEHLREVALEVEGEKAVRVLGLYPEGELTDITGRLWRA